MTGITEPSARADTIGALARATGVNRETIRYYERIGLIPAPPRSTGGHRLYGADHRRRLMFVRRARSLGFTLDEVRGLLALADGTETECGRVQELTEAHLAGVRRRLGDLARLEAVLAGMVAACEDGTVPGCPVIEELSRDAD